MTHPLLRRLSAAALVAVGLGCPAVAPPDVSTGELFVEISDALNALRQENAALQTQIDSLREAVARQDTAIARIGAAAGVPPR